MTLGVGVTSRLGLEVLVINLERSPDRLRDITNRLSRAGFAFSRVAGVDGLSLEPPPWPEVDIPRYVRRHGKTCSGTEVACYLSHLAAMRAFLATGTQHGLILEDDAVFGGDLPSVLGDALLNADCWDILTLHGTHRGAPTVTRDLAGGRAIVAYWGHQTSAVAYLINRRAAQVLVDRLLPISLPLDHAFTRSWETGVRFRGILPYPVSPAGTPSTIQAGRKLPSWRRGPTVLFRSATAVQRILHNALREKVWSPALRLVWRPRLDSNQRPAA